MRKTLAVLIAVLPLWATAFAGSPEAAKALDDLFAARHDKAQLKALEKATRDALAAHPDDYGILWRAARLKYWQADGVKSDKMKEKLGKEGWALAEKAVAKNPAGVEGHYYAAITLGAYSQGVGILTALGEGLEGKFNERLDKAIKLDPTYDNAGPLIAKGRYFYELPWPKRDLEKSVEFLQKAIKARPGALRAHLYLAETWLEDGEEKKAKECIDKVFSGGEAYDVAEARRVKSFAKPVKTRIEEELK